MDDNYQPAETFSLTFDLDWAPDEVIEYCLTPIIENEIPCTIFITHKSEYIDYVLRSFDFIEAALHPNFNPLLQSENQKSFKEIVDDLWSLYPQAIGVRSHGHFVSSAILSYYEAIGLFYESGIFVFNKSNLEVLPYSQNFLRIPHFFQDDANLIRAQGFDLGNLSLNSPGLKVFDFHPVHIFLNSVSIEHYEESKRYYHKPEQLVKFRNSSTRGIANLYFDLIQQLKSPDRNLLLMKEIALQFNK